MIDTNISWAEKYRPKSLDDLIFPNQKWKSIIEKWINEKKICGNIALFGPGGLGKSTLAKIIINNIINSPADLKIIKSRYVQEIDSIGEFIRSQPVSSPIKIVMIEEADRLSRQSQTELKEKYTEQFQDYCSIIISSNHPHLIDEHLLQRFLYRIDFSNLDQDKIYTRLSYILNKEECSYNENELKTWISQNSQKGMREMINNLQLSSLMNNKTIIFDDIELNQDIENKVILLTQSIIKNFINCKDLKIKKLTFINPVNSELIGSYWVELTQIITNNYGINYELIFEEIDKSIHFIPMKNIMSQYIETLQSKKYPHLHLLALIGDIMKCVIEMTY